MQETSRLTLAPGKPANPGIPSCPGDPGSPWIEKRHGSGNILIPIRMVTVSHWNPEVIL